MDLLPTIHAPILAELQTFDSLFTAALTSDVPLLDGVLQHIKQRKGKRMRPLLTLLLAQAYGGVTMVSQQAALGLELLHTASLVHDDVVDGADLRRGQPSVHALYDNNVSVLVGDFLLAAALQSIALTANSTIIEGLATLGKTLVSGELLQLSPLAGTTSPEEHYYDIIRRKTAAMFALSAAFGAESRGLSPEKVEECRQFGENIGMAFQIRDDIFDYYAEEQAVGKPTGSDMAEGKLTLPVLYALQQSNDSEMHALAAKVREQEATAEEIAALVASTKALGGIEYAEVRANDYHDAANAFITSNISDKTIAEALYAYVDFVVGRKQ